MNTRFVQWRDPERQVRVRVTDIGVRVRIDEQFFERPYRLGFVINYLLRVGPVAVWRKIASRHAERERNQRHAMIGVGRVLEGPKDGRLEKGDWVLYFATNHSLDWQVISVDQRLVSRLPGAPTTSWSLAAVPPELLAYVGWTPFSGTQLNRDVVEPALRRLVDMVPTSSQELVGGSAVETISVIERLDRDMRKDERPSAVLFGLGNYAKTQILPVIRRQLRLEAIHEVDPDQLATARGFNTTLDTSPRPREGESYDVYFLAGFHHTHAELAVHALRGGGYAVVEKPVATTRRQLQLLKETAMRGVGRGFFACFHKRYSRLDGWAREDLGAGDGKPIDMHALVYEVPIPFHHWYNWPASGSRLVSNGCHWLDYFMWLNAFSPIVESEVHRLRGRDLVVLGRLENDARFVMCLTDTGSSRLGVRDVIELRSGNVTARLIDGTSYVAESSQRVLRRRRTNPIGAYERMYSEICRRIVAGAPGDSVESLRSAEWTLALEDELADDANGHLARGPRLGAG